MSDPARQDKASGVINVCAELNRFRQKLLDLSNTNRLLNYRKTLTRTIQIVDELPNEIFDRLVLNEKPFAFLPAASLDNELLPAEIPASASTAGAGLRSMRGDGHELPEPSRSESLDTKRYVDDKLQTDLPEKRLERALTRMRQEANAAIEETGVNYLFLALGMLEWREREGSERVFLAPLILVPLRLDRSFDGRTNKYRTTVSYSGEDIQQNLCLAKRIENDFGVVLPEYQPEEDEKPPLPETHFSRVAAAIANKPDWRIRREGADWVLLVPQVAHVSGPRSGAMARREFSQQSSPGPRGCRRKSPRRHP